MVSFVLLLIRHQRYQLSSLTDLTLTLISTCSILRQSGVLTMKWTTRETSVSFLTTGKTLGGNHSFTITQKTSALIGDRDHSSTTIKTVVQMSTSATIAMGGKSKNTIQRILSWILVSMVTCVTSHTAHITITTKIEDKLCLNGLRFFLKQGS